MHDAIPAPIEIARTPSLPRDVIVWSHVRWSLVFQRPQHLITRMAQQARVLYVEEEVLDGSPAWLEVRAVTSSLSVVVPHMPPNLEAPFRDRILVRLLQSLTRDLDMGDALHWFTSPTMLPIARELPSAGVVYDCTVEGSISADAPPHFARRERELLAVADLVFTSGASLQASKARQHKGVFCFPSSVDLAHFGAARTIDVDPPDQAKLRHPRLGTFGTIDDRLDMELLYGVATLRPRWQIVLVGPVAKLDPKRIPQLPNVHVLGVKAYSELPAYLAGWDVATIPYALNDATRFLSPTKTQEYMAGGKPIVATPVRDIVHPYGDRGLVHIADNAVDFVRACEVAMLEDANARIAAFDEHLDGTSWNRTFDDMLDVLASARMQRRAGKG